jgi:hypothetical protein
MVGCGILAYSTYIRAQLAFENIALVDFGLALDALSQIERLFLRRHLPHSHLFCRDALVRHEAATATLPTNLHDRVENGSNVAAAQSPGFTRLKPVSSEKSMKF